MDDRRGPIDPAVPEADAAEQSQEWKPADDEAQVAVPLDVSEFDAVDQSRPAGLDDEDYDGP
ncbi:MAG: hypothetical protein ABR529_07290 [Actinomycetota bacterium]